MTLTEAHLGDSQQLRAVVREDAGHASPSLESDVVLGLERISERTLV